MSHADSCLSRDRSPDVAMVDRTPARTGGVAAVEGLLTLTRLLARQAAAEAVGTAHRRPEELGQP